MHVFVCCQHVCVMCVRGLFDTVVVRLLGVLFNILDVYAWFVLKNLCVVVRVRMCVCACRLYACLEVFVYILK